MDIITADREKAFLPEEALFLAPMAEVTHGAFRQLIAEMGGCDYFYTEMLSAAALINYNTYEKWYLLPAPAPRQMIYQLVGDKEATILKAAELLAAGKPFGIDINMGCSVSHIVKKGWGLAWMRSPDKAALLIRRLRALLPAEIRVSAKFRIGFQADREYLHRFAGQLEQAGADFLVLHPKTNKTPLQRPPDWEVYHFLKARLTIPLVANGMINGPEPYRHLHKSGTAIPAMIGREAIKRPWIFRILKGHDFSVNLLSLSNRFLALLRVYQPEDFWLSRCFRFYAYFTQNLMYGHQLFKSMQRFSAGEQFGQAMTDYFHKHPAEACKSSRGLGTAGPAAQVPIDPV